MMRSISGKSIGLEKQRERVEGQEWTHGHCGHAVPWLCHVKYLWTHAPSVFLVLASTFNSFPLQLFPLRRFNFSLSISAASGSSIQQVLPLFLFCLLLFLSLTHSLSLSQSSAHALTQFLTLCPVPTQSLSAT